MSDKKIPPMPVFRPHPNAIDLMAYYKEVMAGRVKGNIALTIDSILESKSPNRGYMYGFDSAGKPMYRDSDTQSPVTEEGILGEHMMRTAGIEFVAGKSTIPIALGKQMRGLSMSGGLRRGEYFNHAAFTTRTPYDRPRSNVLADALANLKNHSRIGLISLETPSFFDQIRGMRYRPSFSVYDTDVDVDGNVRHFVKQFRHPGWVTTGRAIAKRSSHEPFLTIQGSDGYVGGKRVVSIYNIRYDHSKNIYYFGKGDYYSRIGQSGAYGQISHYTYNPMYLKPLPSQPLEPWAEEAIDSMLYQRMYGTLPKVWNATRREWGVLRPNGVLQGTMVHYEKMRARKRLQEANQMDTGRKKRGR